MLQSPLEATLRGVYTFRWQSDYMLVGNQAFEVVLWKNGQSAFIDGLGPAGVTTQSELRIDLDQAMALIPQLMAGQDYRWGILLVETIPYRRVKYLGGDQLFRLERNDNGSGSSGGSNGGGASKPTQVPTATPRG